MERRNFTKVLGLSAVALSASGFVRFNGTSFEGDCETTSDILGPFYRPGSPMRDNLVVPGSSGKLVELSGVIHHKDCTSPFKGAKVELWHCSADGVYDNHSDEFLYRGAALCNDRGEYKFMTQLPVPYDVGNGSIRPAHFHLLVSAKDHKSLITQIYFTGDSYLKEDVYAADNLALGRILPVSDQGKMARVTFDVNMSDKLLVSYSGLDQIVGKYRADSGKEMELFSKDRRLWKKNEVFGEKFDYVGENLFEYSGMPTGMKRTLHFNISETNIKVTRTYLNNSGKKSVEVYEKT